MQFKSFTNDHEAAALALFRLQKPRFLQAVGSALTEALFIRRAPERPSSLSVVTPALDAVVRKFLASPEASAFLAASGGDIHAVEELSFVLFQIGLTGLVNRHASQAVFIEPSTMVSVEAPPALIIERTRAIVLRAWFADARRIDDGIDDSLPPPDPAAAFRIGHAIVPPDGGAPVVVTGWITRDGVLLQDAAIAHSLVSGYRAERAFFARLSKEHVERLRMRSISADPSHAAAVVAALSSISARLDRAVSFVDLSDHWRRRRAGMGAPALGDGSDRPSHVRPAMPWWTEAADEGRVTPEVLAAAFATGRTWSWLHSPKLVVPLVVESAGPVVVDGEASDVGRMVAGLLLPGGQEIGARLARAAMRLVAVAPDSASFPALYTSRLSGARLTVDAYALPAVPGDPDPRRIVTRVLSAAERLALFRGVPQPAGSAGASGFRLPVGSVIVIPDAGPAYLRGRGWRIDPRSRLVAWDWRGEPGSGLLVGGIEGPGRDASGRRNLSGLPLQEYLHCGGHRWWNLDGSGALLDETEAEWEDRRDRVRAAAWEAVHTGAMTPSRWRWLAWTLIGHHGGSAAGSPAPGEWRSSDPVAPPLGDALRFSAGRSSMRTEWSDPVLFARRWADALLPPTLRDHRVHRAMASRPGGDDGDYLSIWMKALASCPSVVPDVHSEEDQARQAAFASMRDAALGGRSFKAFWSASDAARSEAELRRSGHDARIAAHRAWMIRRTVLVEVVAEGSLVRVPWSWDAFPEPFIAPAVMAIPTSSHRIGIDFTSLVDQGNGPPDAPSVFMSAAGPMEMLLPSALSRLEAADSPDRMPLNKDRAALNAAPIAVDHPDVSPRRQEVTLFRRAMALLSGELN